MSEILITGIEMPKIINHPLMLSIKADGSVIKIDMLHECFVETEAKAQKLPPHGDLIERSSVYKVLDDRIALYKEAGDEYNACNIACIEGDIVVMPTIIEASTKQRQGD